MAKTRILFKIGFLYHKAAFDPVIELFLADPRYEVFFSLDEEKMRRFGLFNVPYRPRLLDELARDGYRFTGEKAGYDVVVAGDPLRDVEDYGDTLRCFLNHGTGIKSILYRNLAANRHIRYEVFVEGQYRVEKVLASGSLGKSRLHLVGLPKLDWILEGRYGNSAPLLERWGLDPGRPTVLFAPTYKPTCLYDVKDAIFEATRDMNLVVKLHHYSWMGRYAPHRQHRIYEQRVGRFPHAVLLPLEEYNIAPWMAAADTLLSEASSTVFDLLALGKTGIIYDLPGDRLRHSDGQPILDEDNRSFLKDAFVHIDSPEAIGEGVRRALAPTDAMLASQAEECAYRFHQLDGRASERFKERVEELLGGAEVGITANGEGGVR
jgi:hypothetical protein